MVELFGNSSGQFCVTKLLCNFNICFSLILVEWFAISPGLMVWCLHDSMKSPPTHPWHDHWYWARMPYFFHAEWTCTTCYIGCKLMIYHCGTAWPDIPCSHSPNCSIFSFLMWYCCASSYLTMTCLEYFNSACLGIPCDIILMLHAWLSTGRPSSLGESATFN